MKIAIVEVGPRDGFQSVKKFIPTELKKEIIDGLVQSGIKNIQVTSFVKAEAIPQLQDAAEIAKYSIEKYPDLVINALTANGRGIEYAIKAGVSEINYAISLSEIHNMLNTKRTHDQSFHELETMVDANQNVNFVLDIGTAFGYYNEQISLEDVMGFIKRGYDIGIRAFDICDSIGIADPGMVKKYITCILKEYKDCQFDVHIHDTRNMGIINTYTAIECGITRIQTTLGGLGGCPFAHGATGNTCTEDMVFLLHRMGYETGINFDKLLEISKYQFSRIKGNYSGHHVCINLDNVKKQ